MRQILKIHMAEQKYSILTQRNTCIHILKTTSLKKYKFIMPNSKKNGRTHTYINNTNKYRTYTKNIIF